MIKREVAYRIFASELNDSNIVYPHDVITDAVFDQKTPKYALTPIGAMVNRLYVTGRIQGEVEESEDRNGAPFYKLRIVDGMWRSARSMIEATLRREHSDWDDEQIRRETARRLSHGTV